MMPRNKEAQVFLSLFLVLSLLFVGCGGGKRSPPSIGSTPGRLPSPPSMAKRPVKLDEAPPIRVLLKANFGSVPVEGSDVDSLRLLQSGGGKIQLSDGKGRVLRSSSGFRLQSRKGEILKLDGVAYEGTLEVFVNPLGSPVIVNELSLETYLKGVVPNELSTQGPSRLEALKALSVAARTFAFSSLGQNASRG
ncbi:MAG: SpoIID/LytB domain-containing protein, partial [Acidobacteria bacterium]|nr:SpoIID/LytB domain-containing protein [Acidobacteriota bacterium]